MIEKLAQVQASRRLEKKHLIILEPSCGHGNIIWQLVEQHLDHLEKNYTTIKIVGIDLDPRVIAVCEKRYSNSPELQNSAKLSLEFYCQSFLTSKVQDFIETEESSPPLVVAIGGPPYGSKPEERSLPQQFVQQCMEQWDCQVIAFLVPQRFPKSLEALCGHSNDMSYRRAYACQSEELACSTFLFKGETTVKQPSRIQCYYRTDHTR